LCSQLAGVQWQVPSHNQLTCALQAFFLMFPTFKQHILKTIKVIGLLLDAHLS